MRTRTAVETDSRCSAVSAGPSIGSPASSGSGSHSPTYTSRRARADCSWVRHRLVSARVNQAAGTRTWSRSAPSHRRNVSWTASSASAAEPSRRYAIASSRGRSASNASSSSARRGTRSVSRTLTGRPYGDEPPDHAHARTAPRRRPGVRSSTTRRRRALRLRPSSRGRRADSDRARRTSVRRDARCASNARSLDARHRPRSCRQKGGSPRSGRGGVAVGVRRRRGRRGWGRGGGRRSARVGRSRGRPRWCGCR